MPSSTPQAKEIEINVVGGCSFGRYPKISLEKTFNFFESDGWLVPTGGFQKVLELISTKAQGRGFFNSIRGNFMLAVINANVYTISPTFNILLVGTLTTQVGDVFIDENLNEQICIVDGVHAYIYNYTEGGSNLTIQTGGAFSAFNMLGIAALVPNYVTYHNDLFLFANAPNYNNSYNYMWYAYEYASPTTISQVVSPALSIQTKPDYPIAIKRIPGQANNVMVFGTSVCEIWTRVNTTQLYRKNTSVSIDFGCLSIDTIAANDQYLAWLGVNETNGPVIMIYTGQSEEQISSDGISYLMGTIKFPAQSTATFLKEDGHVFYQLTFFNPADNITLRYDFNTKKFSFVTDENLNYFPACDFVYFNGSNYFISLNDGALYQSSTDFTNYNYNLIGADFVDYRLFSVIPRIRIPGTIRTPRTSRFRANAFYLTIEQGVDNGPYFDQSQILLIAEDGTRLVSETGVQLVAENSGDAILFDGLWGRPRIDLSISNDGGMVFGNTVSRLMNKIGYRKNIMQWNQMGQANELTLQIRAWSYGRIVLGPGALDAY